MKLLVIQLLGLMNGFAGQVHAQLLEDVVVYLSQNDRGVYLTAAQTGQMIECQLCNRVGGCRDGQRDQHFVGVQARVVVAQPLGLELLDGLDDERGQQRQVVRNVCQMFECVDERSRGRAEQGRGLAGHDRAVRQLDCSSRIAVGLLRALERCGNNRTVFDGDLSLLHE